MRRANFVNLKLNVFAFCQPTLYDLVLCFFFFKQKTAYEIGLGIPAEPLFRSKPPRFGGMKTYNWEGVNPDGYFLDKLEPIPSALPSFQKLFQVSATALSIP